MSEVLVYGSGSTVINPTNNGQFVRYVKDLREFKRRVLTEDFAIIIIDLERRGSGGMEAAAYVKQIPRHCLTPIIILCNTDEYEAESFHNIHCYDYFIKPIGPNEMLKLVSICMQRMSVTSNDKTVIFHSGNDRYPVDIADIYFIEIVGRSAMVTTKNSKLKIPYLVLDDFLGKYGAAFTRIHRSIAVNKNYVRRVNIADATLELADDHVFGIGRKYISLVRKEFDVIPSKSYTRKK